MSILVGIIKDGLNNNIGSKEETHAKEEKTSSIAKATHLSNNKPTAKTAKQPIKVRPKSSKKHDFLASENNVTLSKTVRSIFSQKKPHDGFKQEVKETVEKTVSAPKNENLVLGANGEPTRTENYLNQTIEDVVIIHNPSDLSEATVVPKDVIVDVKRPSIVLEVNGTIYKHPIKDKTFEQYISENEAFYKENWQRFMPDENAAEEHKLVYIAGEQILFLDTTKVMNFISEQYLFDLTKSLTEQYGTKTAHAILFGTAQGNYDRLAALKAPLKSMHVAEYDNNIPLDVKDTAYTKIEVKPGSKDLHYTIYGGVEYSSKKDKKPQFALNIEHSFTANEADKGYKIEHYSIDSVTLDEYN